MHYRLVPTSFDPNDPVLSTLRFSATWQWQSLAEALKRYSPKIILVRLPLFWQILSPLHGVCTKIGCAFYQNEQENSPLGEAASRVGEANVVLTDAKDAFAFSLFLAEKNVRIPSWVIVHEPTGDWDIPILLREKDISVAQEVHLFPGIPILAQCDTLAKEKLTRFHRTEAVEDLFDPTVAYTLDPALVTYGTCTCGKDIVGRPQQSHA